MTHRLKDIREQLGITQQQLASLLQHPRMAIAHIETGNRLAPHTMEQKLLTIEDVLTAYTPAEAKHLPLTEVQTKLLAKDKRVKKLQLSKLELQVENLETGLAQTQRLQQVITTLQTGITTADRTLQMGLLLRIAGQQQQQQLQQWCKLQVARTALVTAIATIDALLQPEAK